jgi:hypothetical protein
MTHEASAYHAVCAALVDFAQATNLAAIIDDVLLASSSAGHQFKRLYKTARGQKSDRKAQLQGGSEFVRWRLTNRSSRPFAPPALRAAELHRKAADTGILPMSRGAAIR